MKTIVIFSSYYLPHLGGVERYTYNLAKQLHNMGHRIIIVTCQYSNELKLREQTDVALVYRFPISKICAKRYPIFKKNKIVQKIFQELSQEKIDVALIQTRFWLLSYYAAEFTYKNHIPSIIIEHGSNHLTIQNPILDKLGEFYEHALTHAIKKYVKQYYGVSSGCTNWLKHFNIDANGKLYNSIDADEATKYKKYIKKSKNQIVITFAGRMLKDKGVIELIKAFQKLNQKYPHLRLNLAGNGPLDDTVRLLTKDNKNIHFLGNLSHDQVLKLLGKTSIFVNPSRSEGMPTAILEAGMMQCAVVATPVGGTTEIIPNSELGRFCALEITSIEKELEKLILNPRIAIELGKNLQKYVLRNFTWQKTSKDLIKIIDMQ